MTKKLYDADAYMTEFDARVLSCEEKGQGMFAIILDQTLFFPEEGGQTPDKGTISTDDNTVNIVDVQISKDNIITHFADKYLEAGTAIHGKIDFTHRYNNMQQHTGEHIFSGIAHSLFGCTNVGFHLSDSIVTMDYDKQLSQTDIAVIEKKVNEAIAANIEVICEYPDKEILDKLDYRSKIELTGDVRIVTIPGVDCCACCAPHVKSTAEVGILKVQSVQNYKGGTRVSILCGLRAFENYRMVYDQLADTAHYLSVKQDEVYDSVSKLLNERNELIGAVKDAQRELLMIRLDALDESVEDCCIFTDGIDNIVARNAVNTMTERHCGYCAIFNGNDKNGYSFIIGSKSKDCREFLKIIQEKMNCRGGGKNEMVQGSVYEKKSEIEKLF